MKAKRKARTARIRFFTDGPRDLRSLPLSKVIEQLLPQYVAMAKDEDPNRRAAGKRKLAQIAAHIEATEVAKLRRIADNRRNASADRHRKRSLAMVGLRAAIKADPDLTAESLLAQLEAGALTFERQDVELSLHDGDILVRNLKQAAAVQRQIIARNHLRKYLFRSRRDS